MRQFVEFEPLQPGKAFLASRKVTGEWFKTEMRRMMCLHITLCGKPFLANVANERFLACLPNKKLHELT